MSSICYINPETYTLFSLCCLWQMCTCSRLIWLQQQIIDKQHAAQMFQFFIQSKKHFRRSYFGAVESTQENKIWTRTHEACFAQRGKTYTNKTLVWFWKIRSPVRKKQTRCNLKEIWRLTRKCYVGKLCASHKLKYEQCFGTKEWMPWACVRKTSLNSHKYISIDSIYYVVKRLIHCNNMIKIENISALSCNSL